MNDTNSSILPTPQDENEEEIGKIVNIQPKTSVQSEVLNHEQNS